jgi:hypothetical protein
VTSAEQAPIVSAIVNRTRVLSVVVAFVGFNMGGPSSVGSDLWRNAVPETAAARCSDDVRQGNAEAMIGARRTCVIMAEEECARRAIRSSWPAHSDKSLDRIYEGFMQNARIFAFCTTNYAVSAGSATRITLSSVTAHTSSPSRASMGAHPVNSPNAGRTPTSAPNQKHGVRSR